MHKKPLDGLRFISFFVICLMHVRSSTFWIGAYGVPVFFTLSGFLITIVLLAHEGGSPWTELKKFYVRRALRIFPPFYLTLLLVLPFTATGAYVAWHATYLVNFKLFASTPEYFLDWMNKGFHFWSLAVEEQFYLTYPALLLFFPRHRRALLVGLFAGGILSRTLLAAYFPDKYWGFLYPGMAEYFVCGAIAAYFLPKVSGAPLFYAGVVILIALIAGHQTTNPFVLEFQPGAWQTVRAIAFSLIIAGVWNNERFWAARLLSLPPLVYLGRISYGLYLVHPYSFALFAYLRSYVMKLWAIPTPLGAFMVNVIWAMLLWHLFEVPILRWRRSYSRSTGEASPPTSKRS